MYMKKSKIILSFIIGMLILILVITAILYSLVQKDKKNIEQIKQSLNDKLTLNEKIYEYGSEITLDELGLDNEAKIFINNEELNNTYKFTEVGEFRLKAKIKEPYKSFFNKEEIISVEKEVTIKVEDTKNPIIYGIADKQINQGEVIDLKRGITVRDEIDGDLEFIIEGEVDTNKVGEYEIKVKATDKNNNTTEATYKVIVNAKTEEVTENVAVIKSNQNTQSNKNNLNSNITNNSSKGTTSNSVKDSSSNGTTNNKNLENTTDEPTTYEGTTDNKKYYFQHRGEEGNYSEKFTW